MCVKSTRNNILVPLIIRYLGRRVIPIAINYPVAHNSGIIIKLEVDCYKSINKANYEPPSWWEIRVTI